MTVKYDELEFPLASLFPLLTGDEFDEWPISRRTD
jgi:hypothetical protein